MRAVRMLQHVVVLIPLCQAHAQPAPPDDILSAISAADTIVVGRYTVMDGSRGFRSSPVLVEPNDHIVGTVHVERSILLPSAGLGGKSITVIGEPHRPYGIFFLTHRDGALHLLSGGAGTTPAPAPPPGYPVTHGEVGPSEAVAEELVAVLGVQESIVGNVNNGLTMPAGSIVEVVHDGGPGGKDVITWERPSATRLAEQAYMTVYNDLTSMPTALTSPILRRFLDNHPSGLGGLGRLWAYASLIADGDIGALAEMSPYMLHPNRDAATTNFCLGQSLAQADFAPTHALTFAKLLDSTNSDIREGAYRQLRQMPRHEALEALERTAQSGADQERVDAIHGLCEITDLCTGAQAEQLSSHNSTANLIKRVRAWDAEHPD